MAEKEFNAGSKKKGHTFILGDETFHTYPGMSYTFFWGTDEEESETARPLQATIKFIRSLVVKEERERFDHLLETPDVYIDVQDILDLSRWLVEVISGRPTKSRGSSGNGAARTSTGSKGKSSKQAGATGRK
jgi:hypothetical protein